MRIIVAPDSYKGCLSAREVAKVMAEAVQEGIPEAEVVEMPLADGGEGTVSVVTEAIGGEIRTAMVSDPLGRKVEAGFGIFGETAVIEIAEACGLQRLSPQERNPLIASTEGVGQLLLAARNAGCRKLLVGLGGSATCDGGTGMLAVPGLREAMRDCEIEILCDVDNPLLGPSGAATVFAPQKGAKPEDISILEARLTAFAEKTLAETGIPVANLPGAGAAGGLGAAFMAWLGARRSSGIGRILELTRFRENAEGAELILTGEGKSDRQTLAGKVPLGVLNAAGNVPVWLVSGAIEEEAALLAAGFKRCTQVTPPDVPLDIALRPAFAREALRKAVSASFAALRALLFTYFS